MGFQEISLNEDIIEAGSVHGRFQPLHNEHLEYIITAKRRCRRLWIGITKFDLDHLNPLGRHRERPEANPLTYFERIEIIRDALVDYDISPADFTFVPFPIENPSTLVRYLPVDIPCYTTICEEWNREKIKLLQSVGYKVIVLWERQKSITGSSIRNDIVAGGTKWQSLVPLATKNAVERLRIGERLQNIEKMGAIKDERSS